jgi:hypothetical protein
MEWWVRQSSRARSLLQGGAALFALALPACAASAPRASLPTPPPPATVSWLHEADEGALRLNRFGALHESVRLLLIANGMQAEWVRNGVVSLPLASCRAALHTDVEQAVDCMLIAVDTATAVLILSESNSCDRWTCLEHSWVFLSDYDAPLPLPARRALDYGSLRADLSREVAETLWLAGYRGSRDPRLADGSDPYGSEQDEPYAEELPDLGIASYKSCRLSPEGGELVCRSRAGGVVGLDPRSSVQRMIASLEHDLAQGASLAATGNSERVWWTSRGELALKVKMQRHPLCGGGPCTLLGLLPWPVVESSTPRFVRLD